MAQPLAVEHGEAPRGTIVEFIGLPGSGKSTIAHALANLLRGRGRVVSEPTWQIDHGSRRSARTLRKATLALAACTRHPRRGRLLVRGIVDSRQPTVREAFQLVINALYLSEAAGRCARVDGVHVFDQGLLQQLWSVLYRAGDGHDAERQCAEELTLCGGRMHVVIVDAPLPTVQRRLASRTGGASRFERHLLATGPQAVLDRAVFAQRRVEALASALDSLGSLKLLRVSGAGDLAVRQAARAVGDWLD